MPKKEQNFNPYQYNGGTVLGIGGKGFGLIASETRLVAGYSIYTRKKPKNFVLTSQTVLGSTGCWCDVLTFIKTLEARLKLYECDHNKLISTEAAARLVSNMLYQKRFFPYYVNNIIVGLDENGDGVVYSYDPVGSLSKLKYYCAGNGSPMIQPVLDNQIGLLNWENPDETYENVSKERALQVCKDAFNSAAERDIYFGDGAHIIVITKDGNEEMHIALRKD